MADREDSTPSFFQKYEASLCHLLPPVLALQPIHAFSPHRIAMMSDWAGAPGPSPCSRHRPTLSYLRVVYRCRELGAALERYATASTLYNVQRSLGE